jgi:hypothetical protein
MYAQSQKLGKPNNTNVNIFFIITFIMKREFIGFCRFKIKKPNTVIQMFIEKHNFVHVPDQGYFRNASCALNMIST